MGYAQDIKALTSDVAKLTQEVNKLHGALTSTGKESTGIFSTIKSILGFGGQKGLGSTGGNILGSSLGNFSTPPKAPNSMNNMGGGGGGGAGGGTVPNGGGASFGGAAAMSAMKTDMRLGYGYAAAGAIKDAAMAIPSTLYNAVPDVSTVVNRAGAYYQAGLRAPGITRASLERATFSALKGGITGIGSDAQVANILANAGYVPGGQDYLAAARQVRGAATYLGMENTAATQAIAGLQGGPMAANLYQYGITTMNANGSAKSVGDIASQLYKVMFPSGATAQSVQKSIRSGYAGLNLQGMGMSPEQQQMITQAFIDIASGKNPDLASAKSSSGNQNPFDPLLRMNTSSTELTGKAEKGTISGLGAAAGTIETFNRNLGDTIASLSVFKGYLDGLSGNPQGSALKKGGSKVLGALKRVAGIGLMATAGVEEVFSGGTLTPLAALQFGAGATMAFGGGGTPGYGASFGGRNRGIKGNANNLITFGYGARDAMGGNWDSTGGVHQGMDYNVKVGTAVVAVKDGVVSDKALSADYGQAVVIDHEDGYSTVYAHLSSKNASPGARVFAGQEIGKSGKSGNATGPHLHFEVWKGPNNPVDPSELKGAGLPIVGGDTGVTSSMSLGPTNVLAGVVDVSQITGSIPSATGLDYQGKIPPNADINLLDVLKKAGFTGDALTTAYAVAKAESGGRSSAYNGPSNGTGDDSYGLFQINMIGTLGPERLNKTWHSADGSKFKLNDRSDLFDPLTNAKVAYHMSNGGKNWSAWTTYTSGTYKDFLQPGGGGTPGFGANMSVPSQAVSMTTPTTTTGNTSLTGDSKVVNFNVYLHDVSDAQALIWAKKVESYLNNKKEISTMGGK